MRAGLENLVCVDLPPGINLCEGGGQLAANGTNRTPNGSALHHNVSAAPCEIVYVGPPTTAPSPAPTSAPTAAPIPNCRDYYRGYGCVAKDGPVSNTFIYPIPDSVVLGPTPFYVEPPLYTDRFPIFGMLEDEIIQLQDPGSDAATYASVFF